MSKSGGTKACLLLVLVLGGLLACGCSKKEKHVPPVADFTAAPTTGAAPLTVEFTDTSAYYHYYWAWDFDADGTVDSNEPNPTHIYTAPGTYTVSLTVANKGGASTKTVQDLIDVKAVFTVVSAVAATSPPAGSYDYEPGTALDASASSPVDAGAGARYVCTGYSGTGDVGTGAESSVNFTLTQNSTITWLWKTQYELVCSATAGGTVSPAGAAWHDEGSDVTLTAAPDSDAHFAGWSGDLGGSATPQVVTMDQARTVVANFYIHQEPAAAASITEPGKPQCGIVILNYTLSDPDDDPVDVSIEYSGDGGATFFPATQAGAAPTTGLSAPPAGADHVFLWDAYADTGNCYRSDILLRVVPSDSYHSGSPADTGPFTLRQVAEPPAQGVVIQYPYDGAILSTCEPLVSIAYGSSPEAIDTGSLQVRVNGVDVTSQFVVSDVGAVSFYLAGSALPEGFNSVEVSVFTTGGTEYTARSDFFCRGAPLPWPFEPFDAPHKLGHLGSQYQYYGSLPYFHQGIDIMEPPGSALYAVVSGTVTDRYYTSPPSANYYEIAITDQYGFTYQYHHVNAGTVSQDILDAISGGTTVAQGTYIGDIVFWPVYAFHHLHLNCLDPDGNLINPFNLLGPPADTTPPEIAAVYVTDNQGDTSYNTLGGPTPTVSGQVDIVCDASDRDDFGQYILTVREVRYRIEELTGDQSHFVAPTLLWNFDRLPGGNDRYAYIWDVFRDVLHVGATTYYTRGNYTQHRFLYVPTNATGSIPDDATGYWDTTAFPDGTYRIFVTVTDENGNNTTETLDVIVDNP